MNLVNSSVLPETIGNLWESMELCREQLIGEGYKAGILGYSEKSYHFHVDFTWGSLFVESQLESWLKYKTPFVLQIRDEWIDIDLDSEILVSQLGFKEISTGNYIRPLIFNDGDYCRDFCSTVASLTGNIKERLGA